MSKWVPFHLHTIYSILDGIVKPAKLAKKLKECGYTACMITDHGNVSGCIKFSSELKKVGVKAILGTELYIPEFDSTIKTEENKDRKHMVICCKNKTGWQKLMTIVSESNKPENFYYKPRLDLKKLAALCDKEFFVFTGHPGSILYKYMYDMDASKKCLAELKELFGETNVIIELQLFNMKNQQENIKEVNFLRQLAHETNTRAKACQDVHYLNKEDVVLQRIALCSSLGMKMKTVAGLANKPMAGFFENECFYLPSPEEMAALGYTEEELDMSFVNDQCESFSIQNQPLLPKFAENEYEELVRLCREGWLKRVRTSWNIQEYGDRVKLELAVFKKWGLSGYFLIIQEIINWAKKEGALVGPGRGSSGGSLVAFLIGITEIDPIPYDLSFERFFNESRCSPGNISLPDVDTDFPAMFRDKVIEHAKLKYGPQNVAQISTFGSLKGKAAIKEVLSTFDVCDFETQNEITKDMPNEADIADELEEQKEESIINWCLNNNPKIFGSYCTIEDGVLKGEYSEYFELAIELEGIYKSQGRHAAGVIVTDRPIAELAPIIYDGKTGEGIVAFDKKDAEIIGLVKLDILGLSTLDRLMGVNNLLRFGKVKV